MFEKIIGNDIIKEQLKKSINNNQISHSYLFVGIEGIGKKMLATELAKAILCLNDNKYCNNCKSCVEFDGNNNPDFLYNHHFCHSLSALWQIPVPQMVSLLLLMIFPYIPLIIRSY